MKDYSEYILKTRLKEVSEVAFSLNQRLESWRESKVRQADRLTDKEKEEVEKYYYTRQAEIQKLMDACEYATGFVRHLNKERDFFEKAHDQVLDENKNLQNLYLQKEKDHTELNLKKRKVLQILAQECTDRTRYLLANPQAQIALYGHIRIDPQDFTHYGNYAERELPAELLNLCPNFTK